MERNDGRNKNPQPLGMGSVKEQDAYDSGFGKAIEGALEIIKDYDLYKSDEDGDLVACKWEVWAEIKALEEDRNGKVYRD